MTTRDDLDPDHLITSVSHLREVMGDTGPTIWAKATDTLSAPMLTFIARAPFCCVASRGADGTTDISPRGDGPGFVRALDARTLLIPDRPGNLRYDTLRNILETGHVSLLFMIPRVMDTVRVNGTAQVTRDPALHSASAMQGKVPALGVVVTVDEAYGHCAKAIKRAQLWEPETWVDIDGVPSLLDLMRAHQTLPETEITDMRDRIDRDFHKNLY